MFERTAKQPEDALEAKPQSASVTSDTTKRLQDALNYHAEGYNVIPIPKPGQPATGISNNDAEASSKYADGKSAKGYGPWGELQSQLQTLEDVERRFQNKEDCNIAILTGTVLGILAFDIDGEEAQKHFDKMIETLGDSQIADAMRNTMQTRTGGSYGRHIILHVNPPEFIGNGDCIRTATLWKGNGSHSEIKLKGEGGYIIVPPSLHTTGRRYEFINKVTPATLSREQIFMVLHVFRASNDNNGGVGEGGMNRAEHSLFKNFEGSKVTEIVSVLKEHYRAGSRDEMIFGITGLLFKNGVSLPSANEIISTLCDSTNDEEKTSRLEVLKNTYTKGLNGEELKATSQVLKVLTLLHGGEEASSKALQSILQIISVSDAEGEQDENNGAKTKDSKPANLLMQLVKQNTILFFKDQYGVPNVTIKVANHAETMPIQSKKFEYYISKLYFDSTKGKNVAGSESVNNAIRVIHAQALFSGQERILGLRVAWGKKNREIYYDIGNSDWNVIKITSENWTISKMSDAALFSRFNQRAQVMPTREYSSDIFDQYLDLMQIKNTSTRLLIKVWTIALLIPDIPHPIAIIHGEKGGLKTTFCKYEKRLVDPDKIEVNNIPNEKGEFVQQMYHNYLAIYDNVKYLPPWFSDEICKAVTGAGNSKRTLYTNDDDTIYDYKRCIMISGINNWLTEPDALDRSIIIELERPPDYLRKEETAVEANFEELRPKLFGYILDTLVKTFRIKAEIQLTKLDRMADFEVWGEAIARAMGYPPMEFVNAYRENIGIQNIEAIENHLLAQVVIKFVDSWYIERREACWQSPTSVVLEYLNKVAHAHNIDIINSKAWPKAPNSLTKKLKPILSNLRDGLGINISISRQTSGDKKKRNTSFMRITRTPPSSPPSPLKQADAGCKAADNVAGVEIGGTTTTSTEQQIALLESIQNHSQFSRDGDSGASGDTIGRDNGYISVVSSQNSELLNNYVAFDLEWNTDTNGEKLIYAASFVDNQGKRVTLHIADFDNSERLLLQAVTEKITQYPLSTGWNTMGTEQTNGVDSDLTVLNERCIKNSLPSIIGYNGKGLPFIEGRFHVDLYKVFRNKIIRASVFDNRYRSLGLNDVATALLAKGKLKDVNGQNAHSESIELQKEYVMRDAELVMNLSNINNGQVLRLMEAISQLTGLGLEQVCHSTISAWWSNVFAIMGFAPTKIFSTSDLRGHDYVGGKVIESKKGVYHNFMIVDAVSLYPTMAILHNISFETINCECCTDTEEAKVPSEVLDKGYWICKQREGAFSHKLREFRAERARQKQLENAVMQQGLKILINGGYGLFGDESFKYYDIRVAELITAYGRYSLSKMQKIAESIGFEIVGGDTDSLFLLDGNNDDKQALSRLISESKEKIGIDLEVGATFVKAIITKKKHYFGVTNEGEIIVKGMEGKKNDRPRWVNDIFSEFLRMILFNDDASSAVEYLKESVLNLEEKKVDPDTLKIWMELSKDPADYKVNNIQKKIGLQLGAKAGDLIYYYKLSDGVSLNPQDISVTKYKVMLWQVVKDILEILNCDQIALEQELCSENKVSSQAPVSSEKPGEPSM